VRQTDALAQAGENVRQCARIGSARYRNQHGLVSGDAVGS
jgi:hypothetical protein